MKRFLTLFCLLALAGCASKRQPLTIFAAASTQDVIKEIARDFEREHGTPIACSFAASSTLARQIEQGADADLFLSADERWADYLAEKGLVAERHNLLSNRLVVVTPADHPLRLQQLSDLTSENVKHLALALDPVPAGRYAREALRKAEIWDEVKGRVIEAGDVRATLAVVERAEADAGIVYATDAAASARVKVALEVPGELHTRIVYPLVVLRRGSDSPVARDFFHFLQGSKASERFRKAGFVHLK